MSKRVLAGGWTIAAALAALLVTGCKSDDATTGPAPGTPGSVITVSGKVLGQNNQPVAGVPVFVAGKPSTNSDANGNFSFASVTVPYDITVVNGTAKTALVYKGLTRTDPTLVYLGLFPGTARSASLAGKVSGGAFAPNQPADHVTRVLFSSPEGANSTSTALDGTFGPMSISWPGPATTTGTIYALQFQAASGLPVAAGYKGYGVKSGVVLTDGNPLINQFDTLQTVATAQMTGTVTLPAGYTIYVKQMHLRLSSFSSLQIFNDATPTGTLSYYTPNIPGTSLVLAVGAQAGGGGSSQSVMLRPNIAPGASGVAITLPVSPEHSLPISGATGVDTTVTFSWTAYSGGVHLVVFAGGGGDPTYYIFSAGTSTSIPNLQPFGLGLPLNRPYNWQIYGFAPFSNVDGAAGPTGFLGPLLNPATTTADSYIALSAQRPFQTKP